MFSFLPLGFAAPLVLSALALLPVIWWLLRLTPPRPREVTFPPTRLLVDVEKREETPARSPWWLTLLRLLIATAVIIALAGPIWRPMVATATGEGPLWLLIDNGWTSAQSWPDRLVTAERTLDEAEDRGQPVLLAATADGPTQTLQPGSPNDARDRLRALEPRSWPAMQGELLPALQAAAAESAPGAVVWMTDGLGGETVDDFAEKLGGIAGDASIVAYTRRTCRWD
ncbi:BatA domain-containing protein [Breoghania sp. L-A4]|uniref:BatA domain-containing protein n=1 Tax=Breoghania sp. L-A4 TaxID=2304600 RepID=UPI003204D730